MLKDYSKIYDSIETLVGKLVTEKQCNLLKQLNINTVYDLIYYFPRAYDDRTNIKKINELIGNEYAVIKANIIKVMAPFSFVRKKMVKAIVSDGTGSMEIVWFGMPYLFKTLKVGKEYIFISQVKRGYMYQMTNPEFKLMDGQKKENISEILPIYSSKKEITQNTLRSLIKKVLKVYLEYFEENIPEEIASKYKIMDRKIALKEIHFPTNIKMIELAKRRFAIEELLVLEFGILKDKYTGILDNKNKYSISQKKEKVKRFLSLYDFELTNAQKKVISEIYEEINNGILINRLIQGDVGSGKTIVAMVMLVYMVENGYQGVIMAPTEILATQHYLGVKEKLNKIGFTVELLTSSTKQKNKKDILERISQGEIDIVIGTHSLIEGNVKFKKLGMIIVDEQHRFGVNQRKKLKDKGYLSNLIVMSATPIPRSLALTIYGDLDVSIIDSLPPNRKKIKTKWINNKYDLEKMNSFITKKLTEGSQAYFVAPLIEDSEKISVQSVEKLYEDICKIYKNFNVGIIHGRMTSKEKDEIMSKFKKNHYSILVSTTLIEVGIDVPNATIMSIFNAERFGLAALHQLRGRIGRGDKNSYCFLISYADNDNSSQRLKIMEETNDGFKIAEEDLNMRNAGEIFGVKQSGFSDLKFIDIIHDLKTINLVRDEVVEYLQKNKGAIKNPFILFDIDKKFK